MSEHAVGPSDVPADAQVAYASVSPEEQETIDQALAVVAEHLASVAAALGVSVPAASRDALRRSPLGADLRLAAKPAPGATGAETRAAAERVRRLFLLAPADPDRIAPPWFQATALGRMLARAAGRQYARQELLSGEEAAAQLGVSPSALDRLLAGAVIEAVADEDGALRVPVRAVERCRCAVVPPSRGETETETDPETDTVLAEWPALR